MNKRYKISDLESLAPDELYTWIEGITEEQAYNSDVDGDSDAEDGQTICSSTRSVTPRVTPSSSLAGSRGSTPRSGSPPSRNTPVLFESPCTSSQHKANVPESIHSTESLESEYESDDDSVVDKDYVPPVENVSKRYVFSSEDESDGPDEDNAPVYEPFEFTKVAYTPNFYSNFQFSENYGPTFDAKSMTPGEIFSKYLGEDMIEHVVEQSNLYARQKGHNLNLNAEELKAFIGFLIVMGIHSLPSIKMYWSSNEALRVDRIANFISQKRFLNILRFLHINDNSKMAPSSSPDFDKLYKIRPLISYLNVKFRDNFNPSRNIAIDESMVGFKGRTSLKQYMPMKPTKRGIKVWAAACSKSSHVLLLDIYEGKAKIDSPGTLGERTVLKMSQPYHEKGYCFYFDNFFTTFELLDQLLKKQTFGCGTLRANRKHYPKDLLIEDKKLKTSEYDYCTSKDLSVVKWKDRGKKSVIVASNMHDPSVATSVGRRDYAGNKVAVKCPQPVYDYNCYMGGVDRFDQHMSTYNISWKSRRWWVKLFYYLIDAAIVNSYLAYKTSLSLHNSRDKGLSHFNFRMLLAEELISNYCTKKSSQKGVVITKSKTKKLSGRTIGIDSSVRKHDVGLHLPIKGTNRRCAYCSTAAKVVRSSIVCRKCDVALCLSCFAPFHES